MMGFRGAALDQAPGYKDADQKMIKSMNKEGRFPKHFSQKVNIKKVSMDVMRPWISKRVTELLGIEDEMVVEYAISLLTSSSGGKLDPKNMQVQLTGFLARKSGIFMSELWELLLSAQENAAGVPQQFITDKKSEMIAKRAEAQKLQEELERQQRTAKVQQQGMKKDFNPTGGLFGVEKKKKIRIVDPDELKAEAKAKRELEERQVKEQALQEKLRVAQAQDQAASRAAPAQALRSDDRDKNRNRDRDRDRERDRDRGRRDRDRKNDRGRDRSRGRDREKQRRSRRSRSRSRDRRKRRSRSSSSSSSSSEEDRKKSRRTFRD